jgi:hypothetical protein
MSHPPGEPSEPAQAWGSVRRVREPVAWALLVLAAIIVLVSACQLFNLAGARIPVVPGPVPSSAFALRASSVVPQFIEAIVIVPPVLSVVVVAFCGGLTEHSRQVVRAAAVVQAVTFVLGLISLAGAAASHTRPGSWFILEASGLAMVLTALIFTGAVMWSGELRAPVPRIQGHWDDDEESEDEPDPGEHH